MFVQTIQGRTTNTEAFLASVDRWAEELGSDATGWLGSTGGVAEDGQFFAAVRFESEAAARRNSERPEQGQWWAQTEKLLDGPATFKDSSDVQVDEYGDVTQAGFVQVMHGRTSDPERVRRIMAEHPDRWAALRPDMLGSVNVSYDDGAYTMIMYFTSEADAREGERKEMPPELQAQMEEMNKLSIGVPDFIDLKSPAFHAPGDK